MKQKMIEVAFILVFFAIIMSVYTFGRWSADVDRENGYEEAGYTINEDGSVVFPLELDKIPPGNPQFCMGNDCMQITELTMMSKKIYCEKYEHDGKEYASCSLIDVPFEMLDKFDEFNLTPEQAFGDLMDCCNTTIIKSSNGTKTTVTGHFDNNSNIEVGQ